MERGRVGEAVPGWALAVGRRGLGRGSVRFVWRCSGDPGRCGSGGARGWEGRQGCGPGGLFARGWRSSCLSFALFAFLSFAGCPTAGLPGPARCRRPVTGGCRGSPSLPLEPAPPLRRGDRGLFVPDPRRAASHSETGAAGAGSAVESGDKATSQDPLGKGPRRGPSSRGWCPLSLVSLLPVCEPHSGQLNGEVRQMGQFCPCSPSSSLVAADGSEGRARDRHQGCCLWLCHRAPGRLLGLPCPLQPRAGES